MLGIDAKTFRNWLRQANLAWVAHPKDARLKCLTREQVERLATLHARPLPSPLSPSPARAFAAPGKPESEATILLPTSVSPEADLPKQLSCLETKMTTMQEHLAQLALCLRGLREVRYEQRLRALEALVPQTQTLESFQTSQETDMAGLPDPSPRPGHRLLPAEVRARSRVTALIEYGAQGQYVTVCPRQGVLSLTPDSPQWFDWLASLTAFRFVGPRGALFRLSCLPERAVHPPLGCSTPRSWARLLALSWGHRPLNARLVRTGSGCSSGSGGRALIN